MKTEKVFLLMEPEDGSPYSFVISAYKNKKDAEQCLAVTSNNDDLYFDGPNYWIKEIELK